MAALWWRGARASHGGWGLGVLFALRACGGKGETGACYHEKVMRTITGTSKLLFCMSAVVWTDSESAAEEYGNPPPHHHLLPASTGGRGEALHEGPVEGGALHEGTRLLGRALE